MFLGGVPTEQDLRSLKQQGIKTVIDQEAKKSSQLIVDSPGAYERSLRFCCQQIFGRLELNNLVFDKQPFNTVVRTASLHFLIICTSVPLGS